MKRLSTAYIRRLILAAVLSSPMVLFPAWLSDKQGSSANTAVASSSSAASSARTVAFSSSSSSIAPMRRGFFVPSTPATSWPRASLIQTDLDPGTGKVIVRWQDSSVINTPTQGTRYAVYRGSTLLSSEAALDTAQRVGLVDAGVRVYTDSDVPDGKYFYAVTVVDANNFEYYRPAFDQSYTFDAISVEQGVPIVTGIAAAFESSSKMIHLRWNNPATTTNSLMYVIYQSTSPFISIQDPGVREVGRVQSPATNYSVLVSGEGSYYHAIVTRNPSGRQSTVLRNGSNVTDAALAVKIQSGPDLPLLVTGINSSFDPNSRVVTLRWKYRDQRLPGLVIYHNTTAPMTIKGALSSAVPVHTVRPGSGETNFSMAAANPGNHFFSIVSFEGIKTNDILLSGENTIGQPLVVPYPDFYVRRTNYIVEYVTNVRIINVVQTNTNLYLMFQTNRQSVNAWSTNLNLIKVDRFVTNDRVVISDRTVTNLRVVTNTRVVTNQHIVHLTNIRHVTVTNERVVTTGRPVTVTNIARNDLVPEPYREAGVAQLRSEIRTFFNHRDSGNKNGLFGNIYALRRLQSITRDPDVERQCTLFIGQAYFYLGEYTTAFREFIKLKDSLPEESRGWINRCVERMR
ncbi:MAG TPA: hypothetical protein PK297_01165 [Spirochaetota bacterium]|nr:hypothetical protein [Spirochaetota bacterium]